MVRSDIISYSEDDTNCLEKHNITSDFPKSSFIVADNKTVTSTNIINYAYLCRVENDRIYDTGDTNSK